MSHEVVRFQDAIFRLVSDCKELITLSEKHDDNEELKDYGFIYVPFINKRYELLDRVKIESLIYYGICLKYYYDVIMQELEELMDILFNKKTSLIREKSNSLLSNCERIIESFFYEKKDNLQ